MRPSKQQLRQYSPFLLFVAAAIIHIATLLDEGSAFHTATKLWLMPTLLIAFVASLLLVRARRREVFILGIVALVVSSVGDALLDVDGDVGFLLGLGAFLLAHVAYLVLFVRPLRERKLPWYSAFYLLWWVVLLIIVGPSVGALIVPVAIYGLVLAVSTGFALGANAISALGAFGFLASDTLLAFKFFVPGWQFYPIDAIIMTLYCTGQLLIVLGAVNRERRLQNQPAS